MCHNKRKGTGTYPDHLADFRPPLFFVRGVGMVAAGVGAASRLPLAAVAACGPSEGSGVEGLSVGISGPSEELGGVGKAVLVGVARGARPAFPGAPARSFSARRRRRCSKILETSLEVGGAGLCASAALEGPNTCL
jgi:hypothetical protein